MKKVIMTILVMMTIFISAKAMSYEQARREALFLTDKMAYELNLTDSQYDAAYEVNLDYLMGVTGRDNVYGTYWERRNIDLGYILFDWQYRAFCEASYFYRPLYWDAGYWHFGIYARYPHRTHFYFSRPTVYVSYRGGHSWHRNGGVSYWRDRRHTFNHSGPHTGMRDNHNNRFDRNHSGNRHDNNRPNGNRYDNDRRHDNNRPNSNRFDNDRRHGSSTRVTVNNGNNDRPANNNGTRFGGVRNSGNSSFGGSRNSSFSGSRNSSFGGSRNSSFGSSRNSSFNGTRSSSSGSKSSVGSSRSNGGRSHGHGGGSFGGGRR